MVWNINFVKSMKDEFVCINKYEDEEMIGIIETDVCSDGKIEMELSGLLLAWMADYSSSPYSEDKVLILLIHELVEASLGLFVLRLLKYVPHNLPSALHYMTVKSLDEPHHPNILPW